ncbi:M12 family metallopeptidase [Pleionea litopenaei]|uniref:M12 family metallopeptidase n=1 Tax=Pleionea litopenaei TaxID=3070815 RepID=A0AA51RSI7_9GAMM|nr:M12 family metallopeptidase [Pleionea sp. HL-JVS1]WMS86806.1 M12 family metallopeptidase [Pleionea sp. HL-JVS1]
MNLSSKTNRFKALKTALATGLLTSFATIGTLSVANENSATNNAKKKIAPSNNQIKSSSIFNQYGYRDSIFGFNSHGREVFDVHTDLGGIIKAVDVDGVAYSGDMILGYTKDLKEHGLRIVTGQEAPDDEIGPSAIIRYPSSGYKWPNGTVPYAFASSLGSQGRQAIQYAIQHWNNNTNVNFVPRTNQTDYILVQGGGGCSSWIGRQGGQQLVTLAENCGNGAAVHELGHAVGFFHEQTRTDRDNFVTIYWNNIQSGMEYNFYKTSTNEGQNYGAYDYYSIMHYPTWAFSSNNQATIWPTQGNVDPNALGSGTTLSSGDLAATAAIYGDDGNSGTTYNGSLSGANDSDYQPNGNYFQYNGGSIRATLQGPTNADFDMKLFRWNGSGWSQVAVSETPTSNESITYSAASGYYYFQIYSYSGSGSYRFTLSL